MQFLVLIRGLPGSGKSTMAKAMKGFTHLEADMFFMENGEYKFDGEKIYQAHEWCQHQTRVALRHGENVVVSNTFTRYNEMYPYIHMASGLNIPVHIMVCHGNYKNVHNVPEAVIQNMKKRWEH